MIHHGDLFDVLPTLADNSIDVGVTDPPYGIGFMGKEWDTFKPAKTEAEVKRKLQKAFRVDHGDSASRHDGYDQNPNTRGRKRSPAMSPSQIEYDRTLHGQRGFQEWTRRWASEVYRVLKPGAYLLVCGAPRSFHRMACGLEDAGFHIRDCFAWLFSQGFPKSLNYSCRCAEPQAERDVRSVSDTDVSASVDIENQQGEVLLDGVSQQGPHGEGQGAERQEVRGCESGVEGRRDVLSEARELQTDQVRAVSGTVPADGEERPVRDGASVGDGDVDRTAATQGRSRASRRSRSAKQRSAESGTVADQQQSQTSRTWPVCGRCGQPVAPGWGTALKPAWESIVVARKPFRGSLTDNVIKHGVGGLNIGGCRLDGEGQDRWPPNVAIDDIIAELLDEQTGDLSTGEWPSERKAHKFGRVYESAFPGAQQELLSQRTANTGGASRFFYCAKPSREERDMGCSHVVEKPRDESRKAGKPGGDNPRNRGLQLRGNFHPTVKPVALMRWLVRLVTPPGGTVLDPFTGSGTTGMACRLEMREFVGIEREAAYVEIATRRINATAPLLAEMLESVDTGDDGARQIGLLSDD